MFEAGDARKIKSFVVQFPDVSLIASVASCQYSTMLCTGYVCRNERYCGPVEATAVEKDRRNVVVQSANKQRANTKKASAAGGTKEGIVAFFVLALPVRVRARSSFRF